VKLRRIESAQKLNLTSLLDIMTNILIFLIVVQSPDEADVQITSKKIKLPEAQTHMAKLPPNRIEIDANQVLLNGEAVAGLEIHSAQTWKALGDKLIALPAPTQGKPRGIVVISDQKIPYQLIDRTASQIARAGFSEVFFLSDRKPEGGRE
jgi:biopolymer transport protein ExbD